MPLPVKFDHCVVHVSAWERSNAFYRDVLGAEAVPRPIGFAYRFGDTRLNLHGPGLQPAKVARLPVQPGNSDLCFEWKGPIADAIAHLAAHGVAVERGPIERFGAKGKGTRIIGLLGSFDSEVRIGVCRKVERTSESGHRRLFPRSRRIADGIHFVRGMNETHDGSTGDAHAGDSSQPARAS